MKEISEDSILGMSIKTLIMILGGAVFAIAGYYDLKAEIQEAKELPPPTITRVEFDMKDQLVRETIMNNAQRIEEIKVQLDKIETRLFEIR